MSSNQSSSLKSGVSSIAGGLEATSANLLKSIPSSGSLGIDTTSASLLRSIPSSARILQSTEFLSSDKILQLFTAAARDEGGGMDGVTSGAPHSHAFDGYRDNALQTYQP